jgi:hypothetical protein
MFQRQKQEKEEGKIYSDPSVSIGVPAKFAVLNSNKIGVSGNEGFEPSFCKVARREFSCQLVGRHCPFIPWALDCE